MDPTTRSEIYMAAVAGEYDGELPEPVTRLEHYLKKIKETVENGSSVAPEDIDAAIEAYLNSHDADIVTEQELSDVLAGKVDKETGKSLMTADEHTKLAGIAAGAEVNVQSDWGQNDTTADDYIKNKPANLVQDASYVHTDNNFTNAEKAKADGAIQSTEKGTANGVAELDANGKVPTSQLPSYVDDVLSYPTISNFPATGEDGKIYIDKNTNLSYRWDGSNYSVISPSLALGTTSSTAYRGDWGAENRAAIGTLSGLTTAEKGNLVAAVNEIKSANSGKQNTPDVLLSTEWDTRSNTSATLTENISGYEYVEIFYSGASQYGSVKVYTGNSASSRNVSLSTTDQNGNVIQYLTAVVAIAGTTLAKVRNGKTVITMDDTNTNLAYAYSADNADITVTRIIGYN